jgi:hypothetical protein
MTQIPNLFESLEIRIWILPFDGAQGGELVEPFVIWCLSFSQFKDSIGFRDTIRHIKFMLLANALFAD